MNFAFDRSASVDVWGREQRNCRLKGRSTSAHQPRSPAAYRGLWRLRAFTQYFLCLAVVDESRHL